MTELPTAKEMNAVSSMYNDSINKQLKNILNSILEEARKGHYYYHLILIIEDGKEIHTTKLLKKLKDLGYTINNKIITSYNSFATKLNCDISWYDLLGKEVSFLSSKERFKAIGLL